MEWRCGWLFFIYWSREKWKATRITRQRNRFLRRPRLTIAVPPIAQRTFPSRRLRTPRMLLIKNGRVVDPASKMDAAMDVLLDGGLVTDIAAPAKFASLSDVEIFDAAGMIVASGFIDLHAHL